MGLLNYPHKGFSAPPSGGAQGGPVTRNVNLYGKIGEIWRAHLSWLRPLIQRRELPVERCVLHLYALIFGAFLLTSMAS
jgi:hypothetical protein